MVDATMSRNRSPRGRQGVTLIEMVIVLVLLGIMTAIALPRTVEARRQLTLRSAATQLHGDLSRARMEAVKRNTQIKVARVNTAAYRIDSIGTFRLPDGVTFGSTSPDTLRFVAFGPSPTGAKTYVLFYNGRTSTVSVNVSGMASSQ